MEKACVNIKVKKKDRLPQYYKNSPGWSQRNVRHSPARHWSTKDIIRTHTNEIRTNEKTLSRSNPRSKKTSQSGKQLDDEPVIIKEVMRVNVTAGCLSKYRES